MYSQRTVSIGPFLTQLHFQNIFPVLNLPKQRNNVIAYLHLQLLINIAQTRFLF